MRICPELGSQAGKIKRQQCEPRRGPKGRGSEWRKRSKALGPALARVPTRNQGERRTVAGALRGAGEDKLLALTDPLSGMCLDNFTSHHSSLMRLYRWGNRHRKREGNLPEVTLLEGDRVRIQTSMLSHPVPSPPNTFKDGKTRRMLRRAPRSLQKMFVVNIFIVTLCWSPWPFRLGT